MAAKSGRQIPSLKEALATEPYSFEFDQAVKLVEVMHAHSTPLGEGFAIDKEALTIKSRVYLSAPPSDIYDISLSALNSNYPTIIRINFFGVAGLQGPLPMPFTESIMEQLKLQDSAASDFLDMFNHRLVSILHRIRKKHWVGLDQRRAHETPLGKDLLAFNSMSSGFLKSTTVSPQDMLFYSGLYWQQPRSPVGLRQILSHYFNAKVVIQSHQGGWVDVPQESWTYLGDENTGRNTVLGSTAMIGTKIWDVNQNIRVRVGPLGGKDFESFLKNGSAYPKLLEMLQFYLPAGYKFTVNLVVRAKDVRETRLDGKSYLGWSSWLLSKPATRDDDQVMLYPAFAEE
jgi:type VI secretion system protein ImpH